MRGRRTKKVCVESSVEKERDGGEEIREEEEEENLQGACGGWKTSRMSLLWAWRTNTTAASIH